MRLNHRILDRWYRLEFLNSKGEWEDAGDNFEEESIFECRKEIVMTNFCGHKVRIVEHVHASSPVHRWRHESRQPEQREVRFASGSRSAIHRRSCFHAKRHFG